MNIDNAITQWFERLDAVTAQVDDRSWRLHCSLQLNQLAYPLSAQKHDQSQFIF